MEALVDDGLLDLRHLIPLLLNWLIRAGKPWSLW